MAYIFESKCDFPLRLYSYFFTYFETKRKQIEHLKKAARGLDAYERFTYADAAKAKKRILEACASCIKQDFTAIGLDVEQAPPKWGKVIDRVRAICSEVDYRAVYSNLCSQSHHDALELIVRIVDDTDPLSSSTSPRRSDLDTWVSVTGSLKYYLLAVRSYRNLFDLELPVQALEEIQWEVDSLGRRAAHTLANSSMGSLGNEARRALDDFESFLIESIEDTGFSEKEERAVRECHDCGRMYRIIDSKGNIPSYFFKPYEYREGCGTLCLECWLGV